MRKIKNISKTEQYYMASQWQLMRRKFKKHRLAQVSSIIIILFYITGLFCGFISPYEPSHRNTIFKYGPPQRLHFYDGEKFSFRPFVYAYLTEKDPESFKTIYSEDRSEKYYIRLFVRGDVYRLMGLFRTDIHLFGVEDGTLFLFGTDEMGRDLFSRNLYGSRVSLSIGLLSIAISFVIGCIIGGISGYYGGKLDNILMRLVEFLISIPTIPIWMALAAALPPKMPNIQVYFCITLIIVIRGWAFLARVVRGKFLELKEADFVMAARASGTTDAMIILRHLLPSFMSYLIVNVTLAIPGMILAETALSFLGLGLRAPTISWGTLLQDAQNIRIISLYPWLMIPGIFVVVVVLAFNFFGDGLRDAADPYK